MGRQRPRRPQTNRLPPHPAQDGLPPAGWRTRPPHVGRTLRLRSPQSLKSRHPPVARAFSRRCPHDAGIFPPQRWRTMEPCPAPRSGETSSAEESDAGGGHTGPEACCLGRRCQKSKTSDRATKDGCPDEGGAKATGRAEESDAGGGHTGPEACCLGRRCQKSKTSDRATKDGCPDEGGAKATGRGKGARP